MGMGVSLLLVHATIGTGQEERFGCEFDEFFLAPLHDEVVLELDVEVGDARGVQLPGYTQSQSYYLELCRKHGIAEVRMSDIGGAAPAPAAASATPVSKLSVSQLQAVLRARGVQLPGYTQTQSY